VRTFRLGFSLIFWGLLIALLDFEINLVSILPGFIGFIFILFGIQKVGKEDNKIKKLVPWVYVLIPLSAMEWVSSFFIRPNENMEETALPINPLLLGWFSLLEIALLVMTILFVVKLMNYYIDVLKESKQFECHERFVSRKLFYVWTQVALVVLLPLAAIHMVMAVLYIVVILFVLIGVVRILMSTYRIKQLSEVIWENQVKNKK
jgi:hypothetical protein